MERCTVYVPKRVDGDASVHSAVISKLQALGAACVKRLSKEVTHVVFLRKLLPSVAEQAQQTAALKELHDRVAKVQPNAFIVSNLWVHATAELGHKANEGGFVIARPTEAPEAPFLSFKRTPEGIAGRRRSSNTPKRAGPVPLPVDAFQFDINSSLFSSSQQLQSPGPMNAFTAGAAQVGRKRRQSAPLTQPPLKAVRLQRSSTPGASRAALHSPDQQEHQHSSGLADLTVEGLQMPYTNSARVPEPAGHPAQGQQGREVVCIDLTGLTPLCQPGHTASHGPSQTPVGNSEQDGANRQHAVRAKRTVMWADNLTPDASPAAGLVVMPVSSAHSEPTPAANHQQHRAQKGVQGMQLGDSNVSIPSLGLGTADNAGQQAVMSASSNEVLETGTLLRNCVGLSPLQPAGGAMACMSPPSLVSLLDWKEVPAGAASPSLFPAEHADHATSHAQPQRLVHGKASVPVADDDAPMSVAMAVQAQQPAARGQKHAAVAHQPEASAVLQPGSVTPNLQSGSSTPKLGGQHPQGISAAARLLLARKKHAGTPCASPQPPALAPALRGTAGAAAASSPGAGTRGQRPVGCSVDSIAASPAKGFKAEVLPVRGTAAVVDMQDNGMNSCQVTTAAGRLTACHEQVQQDCTHYQLSPTGPYEQDQQEILTTHLHGDSSAGARDPQALRCEDSSQQEGMRCAETTLRERELLTKPKAQQQQPHMLMPEGMGNTQDATITGTGAMGQQEGAACAQQGREIPSRQPAMSACASAQHQPGVRTDWYGQGSIETDDDGVFTFDPSAGSTARDMACAPAEHQPYSTLHVLHAGTNVQHTSANVLHASTAVQQQKLQAADSITQPKGTLQSKASTTAWTTGRTKGPSCVRQATASGLTKYKQTLLNIPRLKMGSVAESSEGAPVSAPQPLGTGLTNAPQSPSAVTAI